VSAANHAAAGPGASMSPKCGQRQLIRPHFAWSDIWKAPLHDFPIRDEILFQFLPFSPEDEILEAGAGAGFTVFRLARQVRHIFALDISIEPLRELERNMYGFRNVDYVCANLSEPGLREKIPAGVTVAFALDVLEYVPNPGCCLRNLAEVLRPGGEVLISFPNTPPPKGDGVTYFRDINQLHELLNNAGFTRHEIFAVKLRPWSAAVYRILHELPLFLYRRLRPGNAKDRPQTYEATWAFRNRNSVMKLKSVLHLYWFFVAFLLHIGGHVFRPLPIATGIESRQLVIRAWK
jgi:SAM-dependent methyltransferase